MREPNTWRMFTGSVLRKTFTVRTLAVVSADLFSGNRIFGRIWRGCMTKWFKWDASEMKARTIALTALCSTRRRSDHMLMIMRTRRVDLDGRSPVSGEYQTDGGWNVEKSYETVKVVSPGLSGQNDLWAGLGEQWGWALVRDRLLHLDHPERIQTCGTDGERLPGIPRRSSPYAGCPERAPPPGIRSQKMHQGSPLLRKLGVLR